MPPQATVRDAVNRHAARWQQTLDRIGGMEPRGQLQRLRWMETEIAQDELALRNADLQDDKTLGHKIALIRTAIENRRKAIPGELLGYVRRQCVSLIESLQRVREKVPSELLMAIEGAENELRVDRANLAACGLTEPAEIRVVEAQLNSLREAYAAALPRRTTRSAPRLVHADRIEAPALRMSETECRQKYRECGNDWFALKTKYKNDPNTMWQLWAFRKKVVNATITDLQKRYGFTWEAVGSTNLESDYDLSVKTHGKDPESGETVYDFVIVKMFNDAIMAEFGVQPGTLFDTNLYASAPLEYSLPVDPQTATARAMQKMAEAGQDVGALMKQRRYMSWEEYDDYTHRIVGTLRDVGKVEIAGATLKQFEEADALFQISEYTVLEAARDLVTGDLNTLPDKPELLARRGQAQRALRWVEERLKTMAKGDLLEGQQRMLTATLELEHHFPDLHMRTSNDLYVRSLSEVRQLEARVTGLAPAVDRQTYEGLLARIKTLATDAVFFANEAYLSEGPFLHVVKAIQSVLTAAKTLSGPERDAYIKENTAKELARLSANQFLQSFNEQLGDLLKDLSHYAGEVSPGLGFYRSSKYLERLLDALLLLQQKVPDLDVTIPAASMPTAEIKARVARGLLAVRKGQLAFGDNGMTLSGDALQRESEAFAIEEVREMFNVVTLRDLGRRFLDLASRVNAHVRSGELGESMYVRPGEDRPYFS